MMAASQKAEGPRNCDKVSVEIGRAMNHRTADGLPAVLALTGVQGLQVCLHAAN